jgi:purine-nucleoside phosphorylase
MIEKIEETIDFINRKTGYRPKVAIILGSGLGQLCGHIKDRNVINYKDIPNFPVSTVHGHEGNMIFGKCSGKEIVVMQGRFHYYEGYSMKEVTYPIYILKQLGIEKIIITNAAGGINMEFNPGDIMIIEDHINLMGTNPLIGKNNEEFGKRFPDMSEPYSCEFIKLAKTTAEALGIEYKKGVYAGVTGPSYETKAEIKYLGIIGADAVGMSTIPEAITANYLGMDVLGLSCITNMGTGIRDTKHTHEDVLKIAGEVSEKIAMLMMEIVRKL